MEELTLLVESFPGLSLVSIDPPLAHRAVHVATTHRLRGADSIYVAVAEMFNATLVTWDVEIRSKKKKREMNKHRTVVNIPAKKFEQIANRFIEQAAAWDGTLPAETFFESWDTLMDKETLKVQTMIVEMDNEL